MNSNFTLIVNEVLRFEGGYVNNPNDPGGETNYGISKKSYPSLDILHLSKADAVAIYYRDYWLPSGADSLPFPLAAEVFDCAVNQGMSRAMKWKEQCGGDWRKMSQLRREFYLSLIAKNPKLAVFKNGWLNRLRQLELFVEEHLATSTDTQHPTAGA